MTSRSVSLVRFVKQQKKQNVNLTSLTMVHTVQTSKFSFAEPGKYLARKEESNLRLIQTLNLTFQTNQNNHRLLNVLPQ